MIRAGRRLKTTLERVPGAPDRPAPLRRVDQATPEPLRDRLAGECLRLGRGAAAGRRLKPLAAVGRGSVKGPAPSRQGPGPVPPEPRRGPQSRGPPRRGQARRPRHAGGAPEGRRRVLAPSRRGGCGRRTRLPPRRAGTPSGAARQRRGRPGGIGNRQAGLAVWRGGRPGRGQHDANLRMPAGRFGPESAKLRDGRGVPEDPALKGGNRTPLVMINGALKAGRLRAGRPGLDPSFAGAPSPLDPTPEGPARFRGVPPGTGPRSRGGRSCSLPSAAAGSPAGGAFSFGTVSGGASRYQSGSHVDVDGFSLMAGLGWSFDLDEGESGRLLVAPFLEAGRGGYDSYNSFNGYASVKGQGDISRHGGGLAARYETPVGPGRLRVEGSLRLGRVETDFESSDIRNPMTGETAEYETAAAYYGAHAGLGYLWDIGGPQSIPLTLDLYTQFLWTRQEGDSVAMAGERYTFDDVDSRRWRAGARLSFGAGPDGGPSLAPYIGAALDHEFDSKAGGNVFGRAIDSPDIKGATGMGEFGLAFKPSADGGLSLDLGVQGYAGQREGVAGSLRAGWEF